MYDTTTEAWASNDLYISAMPKKIANPKIALLDFGLMKAKMKLGVQVLIEDPDKLAGVRER